MFDTELIKWFASLGVGGVLAGLLFFFYRKDVKSFTDQWKGQSETLTKVVIDNTAAITSNTEVIRQLKDEFQITHQGLEPLPPSRLIEQRLNPRPK